MRRKPPRPQSDGRGVRPYRLYSVPGGGTLEPWPGRRSGRAARTGRRRRGRDARCRAGHRRRAGRGGRHRHLHGPQQRERPARSTTAPRRSRRPPSSSRASAAPASRSSSTISTRPGEGWPTGSGRDHGHIDVLVNDIWGGELLKGGRSGTRRSGSTTSTTGCASSGSPSTRTSSPRTTCCRSSSTGPAACSSR